MSGLMEDPTILVAHCYEMYIEHIMRPDTEDDEEAERQLRAEGKNEHDRSLFDSLYRESTTQLPGRPLHNNYINCNNPVLYEHDTTPVYTPSQYYEFCNMKKDLVLEEAPGTEIPPECAMKIMFPDESVRKSLLKTCRQISEHQAVTDLEMHTVRCESSIADELPIISAHVRSVSLMQCAVPVCYLRYLFHLLSQSVNTLLNLELGYMDLKPIETELDELLELLVSHHKSGNAQSKLILYIAGSEKEPTNLSPEFVNKWQKRCEGIESIDSVIIRDA